MKPLVSVIIPTFNRPDTLKEAVQSVLSQTYGNIEIIVVNDAGDDVRDILNSLKSGAEIVYIIHEINRGLAASRNTAIKAAKGKYIAYLDDDDIFYPEHIETLAGFLEEKRASIAYTDSRLVVQSLKDGELSTEYKSVYYSRDFDRQNLLISNYIPVINVMHRRDALDETGLFDESLHYNEDWDLWIRLSCRYDFHHIGKMTAEVRMREGVSSTIVDRMPFYTYMKAVHDKHARLADERMLVKQDMAERALLREICISRLADFEYGIHRIHRYLFVRGLAKGKRILDICPSDGYGCHILSEAADEVVGMTLSEREFTNALKHNGKNLKFIKGNIFKEDVRFSEYFDIVLYLGEGLTGEKLKAFVSVVRRILKKNGLFIVLFHEKTIRPGETKALLAGFFGQTSTIAPDMSSRKSSGYVLAISSDAPFEEDLLNEHLADASVDIISFKDKMLEDLEKSAADIRQTVYSDPCGYEEIINEIHGSITWRTGKTLTGIVDWIFPRHTKRGRALYAFLMRTGLIKSKR